jgi:hypothetical protein
MISLEKVAQLRKDLEHKDTSLCEQSEIIYQLNLRIEELSCRTPRPDWAEAASKGWPDTAVHNAAALDVQHSPSDSGSCCSTRQLVAAAADKLARYSSALNVRLHVP